MMPRQCRPMFDVHGVPAVQRADLWKHFTKDAFLFVTEKKRRKQLRQQQQKHHIRHALLV